MFRSRIRLRKVREGKQLDRAVEKGVQFFFKKRMTNPPRKVLLGAWFIVYQTDEFVYWGKPIKRGIWGSAELGDFYKTRKKILEAYFPKYAHYEGYHVRIKLQDYILEYKMNEPRGSYDFEEIEEQMYTYVSVSLGFRSVLGLDNDLMFFNTPAMVTFQHDENKYTVKENYKIALYKNDLSLYSIEQVRS